MKPDGVEKAAFYSVKCRAQVHWLLLVKLLNLSGKKQQPHQHHKFDVSMQQSKYMTGPGLSPAHIMPFIQILTPLGSHIQGIGGLPILLERKVVPLMDCLFH